MRALAIALLLLPAVCLANPVPMQDCLYLDVGGSNCSCPGASQPFTVSVTMRDLNQAEAGIMGFAFRLDRTFGGFKLSQTNLLGGLDFGDVETDGWVLSSGADCAEPVGGVIYVGEIEYLYLGTPGTLTPVGHPVDGTAFVDCDNELRYWNLPEWDSLPGGILGVCDIPPEGCATVPVETTTWGAVKALYR